MKKIIDWSQRNEGQDDTTGWSKPLVANYVVILGVAGNPSWKKSIKDSTINLETYEKVAIDILNWVFPEVTDDDIANTKTTANEYWEAAASAAESDYKFGDTILDAAGKRRFRASPTLRSIATHIGAADFQKAEFNPEDKAETIFPTSLDVNWNESWSNFRGIDFENFLIFLKSKSKFESLVVKVGSDILTLCPCAPQAKSSLTTVSRVDDLAPKWGLGKYSLFYGPPGTGKTREANRIIQESLSKQLETHSNGEIKIKNLTGEWTPGFRSIVMRELRKFITVCQFHSTYSYEDFIEGLRPLPGENSEIRYEVVDGSFLAIWRKATGKSANLKGKIIQQDTNYYLELDPYFIKLYDLDAESSVHVYIPLLEDYFAAKYNDDGTNRLKIDLNPEDFLKVPAGKLIPVSVKGDSWSPDNQYYILVDEINRGKVSKIFGELLFAMSASSDDKYPEVRTQYSKTPLILVENLNMFGTMNSCDKSVDVLDQALKRRFQLHELMPLTSADLAFDPAWNTMVKGFEKSSEINLAKLLDGLNHLILETKQVDYDRQIGHSFVFKMNTEAKLYLKTNQSKADSSAICLKAIFKIYFSDIFPVLQDFFVDRRDLLEKFVPKGFLIPNSFALDPEIRRILTSKSILQYEPRAWAASEDEFKKMITHFTKQQTSQKKAA